MNFFNRKKHIALIRFSEGINKATAEKYRKDFTRLTRNKNNIEAVAFVIDSPGGSAVQSNAIANYTRTFCNKNSLKLLTFAEDIAASGGYWLLCIGDEVYSKKASLVGSVGVVYTTIDLKALIEKREINRRYITSKKDDKYIEK